MLHLKRGSAVVMAAVLTVGGLAACAPTAGDNPDTINLLYAAPLTGFGADSGIDGCNGAQLAVENINEAGGIEAGEFEGAQLAVECVDNEGTADATATIANRYIADENIWTMFGFYGSSEAQAAGLQASRANLSVIASSGAAEFLTTDADNIMIMVPRLLSLGYAWAQVCHDYYGAGRVADLSPDASYIPDFRAGAAAGIDDLGLELVAVEDYPSSGTTDFAPFLTKLQQSNPDCIMLGSYPPEQCQIIKQARDMGITAPIVDLSTSGTSQTCAESAGQAYIGSLFGQYLRLPAEPGSLLAEVGPQYEEEYGGAINSYASYAYDSVLLAAQAIADGAANREELQQYMEKVDIPGLAGQIKFEERRPSTRYFSAQEATGADYQDLDVVAVYELKVDGTAELIEQADCADRPSCQTNIG